MNSRPFDARQIKRELKVHAKALKIPVGAADDFIERAVNDATAKLSKRKLITERDLKQAVIKELKKYHKDFAYVYENYDKIV